MRIRSLKLSWTEEEVDALAMALTFTYKTQTTYKEPLDLEDRVMGWCFVLGKKYTLDQVFYALEAFMSENPTMPVPADIVSILNPKPPRITEPMYVEAQRYQSINCYPSYSAQADIIKRYEQQCRDERAEYERKVKEIDSIGRGDFVSLLSHQT